MNLKGIDRRILIGAVVLIVVVGGVAAFILTRNPSVEDVQDDEDDAKNRRPIADAGPDQTVDVDDIVFIDGSGSYDPDGDTLDFYWDMDDSVDDNGDGIFDNDWEYLVTNFTHDYGDLDETTSFRVTLNVSDGELSDKSTMTVTVIVEDDRSTPTVSMTCTYQDFPGPLVKDKYTITITSISRAGEWLSNFTYNLTDSNGMVIFQGNLENLLGAGPNATLRYIDVTNLSTVSRNDQIVVQDSSPVEEGGIFTLFYKRRNEECGSVEIEKRSPIN